MNSNCTDPVLPFVACIGLDWDDQSRALALAARFQWLAGD